MAHEKNLHHEIPSSRYGSSHENNLRRMDKDEHDNYHRLFGNHMFHEAVLRIIHLNSGSLKDDYVQNLLNALLQPPENIYKEHCFRCQKGIDTLRNQINATIRELLDEPEEEDLTTEKMREIMNRDTVGDVLRETDEDDFPEGPVETTSE